MNINIVIPVLNEEKTIKEQLKKVIDFLDETELDGNYIITVADNGSTDHTEIYAKEMKEKFSGKIQYIKVPDRGVGLAFRTAIKQNQYDLIGYMDLDLATDLKHVVDVYRLFGNEKIKIVAGSRLKKDSNVQGRKAIRTFTSKGLNFILKYYLKVGFSDAMCGFKFYRSEVAKHLVDKCSDSNGWFYCAEMMIRAEWDGIGITEVAVNWNDDPNSKVNIVKLSLDYLKEIRKLKKEMKKS